jgi:hypothetical protein
MSSAKQPALRFAVGSPDGPRAGVWRLWAERNDVYIAARILGGAYKISLHESGDWREAFDSNYVRRHPELLPPGRDRTLERWPRPPELRPGLTRAFRILVPRSEVVGAASPLRSSKQVTWVLPAPVGWLTCFTILLSTRDWLADEHPASGQATSRLVGRLELPREVVWVVADELPVPEGNRLALDLTKRAWQRIRAAIAAAGRVATEPRAVTSGVTEDGTRYYLDTAL